MSILGPYGLDPLTVANMDAIDPAVREPQGPPSPEWFQQNFPEQFPGATPPTEGQNIHQPGPDPGPMAQTGGDLPTGGNGQPEPIPPPQPANPLFRTPNPGQPGAPSPAAGPLQQMPGQQRPSGVSSTGQAYFPGTAPWEQQSVGQLAGQPLDPRRAYQVQQLENAQDQVQGRQDLSDFQRQYALKRLAQRMDQIDPRRQYRRETLQNQPTMAEQAYAQQVLRDPHNPGLYWHWDGKSLKPYETKPDHLEEARQKLEQHQLDQQQKREEFQMKMQHMREEAQFKREQHRMDQEKRASERQAQMAEQARGHDEQLRQHLNKERDAARQRIIDSRNPEAKDYSEPSDEQIVAEMERAHRINERARQRMFPSTQPLPAAAGQPAPAAGQSPGPAKAGDDLTVQALQDGMRRQAEDRQRREAEAAAAAAGRTQQRGSAQYIQPQDSQPPPLSLR